MERINKPKYTSQKAKHGSVIQIKPTYPRKQYWGLLMIVDTVNDWGIAAYYWSPQRGILFVRLEWHDFEYIGEAHYTHKPGEI